MESHLRLPTLVFQEQTWEGSGAFLEVTTAFACARVGVMQEGQDTHPGIAPLSQCPLGGLRPNPSVQPSKGTRFLQWFQLLALIKAI